MECLEMSASVLPALDLASLKRGQVRDDWVINRGLRRV